MTATGQLNVGNRSDDAVLHGLLHLAERCDVLGLQECGDRGSVLREFVRRTGWTPFVGNKPGSSSTPILWNPRTVEVTKAMTTPATEATYTGRLGAGPDTVKAKVWNHARVHGEGRPFVFINGHLPASLYLRRRRALAREQIAVLAEMVERREDRIAVVVTMDANCRESALLLNPLRRLGMRQHTHEPTHGNRTIDHVWTLGIGGRAEVVEAPSDHRAVIFNIKEHR